MAVILHDRVHYMSKSEILFHGGFGLIISSKIFVYAKAFLTLVF